MAFLDKMDGAESVRLLSWNVRDLSGDPLAVRAVLRDLSPDVVVLQESPRRPAGVLLRTAPLARAAGVRHVVGGRTSGGTAVLVGPRARVRAAREVRLPVPHWYDRRRGSVLAAIGVAGTELAVAGVHLPLHPDQRVRHAELVRDLLTTGGPSAVRALVTSGAVAVVGDFNEPAGAPCWRVFAALAADRRPDAGPTFPARSPSRRIDAVLLGDGLELVDYGDGGLDPDLVRRASDHVPVLAVLRGRRRSDAAPIEG